MWVARDKDGELNLYKAKPQRSDAIGYNHESWDTLKFDDNGIELDPKLFPDLTWDDEPIEVELVRKNKN